MFMVNNGMVPFMKFLMVILFSAIFSNLTLLFLDPLTIGYRTLTTSIWPGLDKIVTFLELQLIRVPFLSAAVGGFDSLIRPAIFPAHPAFYRFGFLFFGFFVSLIALNALAPRFWCRYICPFGAIMGLTNRFSALRLMRDPQKCDPKTCKTACIRACPMGVTSIPRLQSIDSTDCIRCGDCVDACPNKSLRLRFSIKR